MNRLFVALVAALPVAGLCQDRYPVDWTQVESEALGHFEALLRIDTSNPLDFDGLSP